MLCAKQISDARENEAKSTRSPGIPRVLKTCPIYGFLWKHMDMYDLLFTKHVAPPKIGATLAGKQENHKILVKVLMQNKSHPAGSQPVTRAIRNHESLAFQQTI